MIILSGCVNFIKFLEAYLYWERWINSFSLQADAESATAHGYRLKIIDNIIAKLGPWCHYKQ